MHTNRATGLDRLLTWLTGGLVAAVLLTPVVYLALIAIVWSDIGGSWTGPGEPHGTACSKAVAFAGGSLPAQATGAACSDDNAVQEQGYTATFTMPSEDLETRLTTAFPRVRLNQRDATGLNLGNAHEANGPHQGGQAAEVHLKAVYQADGTALVTLRAFDL
ncbi:hypothetical protein [Kitasatospora sp. NPDC101183]|uniref:hypothetical protein n=1 Tax=Kitasatospora sp. NPDC101183 TaxID=3364100 RepID=UPI00381FFFAB